MVTIDDARARELRSAEGTPKRLLEILSERINGVLTVTDNTKLLLKVNKLLREKWDYYLGQIVFVKKSYFNIKTNCLSVLPPKMLDCPNNEGWFFYISGYDPETKKMVVARFFNNSERAVHFIIPSMKFVMSLPEHKESMINASKKQINAAKVEKDKQASVSQNV